MKLMFVFSFQKKQPSMEYTRTRQQFILNDDVWWLVGWWMERERESEYKV